MRGTDGAGAPARPAGPRPRPSVGRRFARGVAWNLVGTAAGQGLGLLAAIAAARLLGRVGFGEFGMVSSTLNTFGILAGLGVGLTATRYVAEYRESDLRRAASVLRLATRTALVSGGLIAALAFLFAPLLAARVLDAPHLAAELRIGAAVLLLNALGGAQTGALAGLEAFRAVMRVNVLRGVATFPLVVTGAGLFGVPGAVAATTLAAGVAVAAGHHALRRACARAGVPVAEGAAAQELPILWRFAVPAVLGTVAYNASLWLGNVFLANQRDGYGELGLLSAAYQWNSALMLFPAVLLQVALPLMAAAGGRGDGRGDFDRALLFSQSLIVTVVLPVATALLFLSDRIMALYGEGFRAGGPVLVGIGAANMISSVGSATGSILQARGRMWLGFCFNLTWGAVLVGAAWLLAPAYGARAIAFAAAAAYLALSTWSFLVLRAELPPGMLRRLFFTLGYAVALTLACMAIPAERRAAWAAPAVLGTLAACLAAFSDPGSRRLLFALAARKLAGPRWARSAEGGPVA